jgi:hypothetical protein
MCLNETGGGPHRSDSLFALASGAMIFLLI